MTKGDSTQVEVESKTWGREGTEEENWGGRVEGQGRRGGVIMGWWNVIALGKK